MSTLKFLTVPSKRLSASIDATDSSFKLNNIKGWDDVNLAASDLGSIAYAILRNDNNTKMEIVEIDPSTIADSSITIDRRGLKFDGDLTTEVTTNKLSWTKNETIVELGTNVPQLLNHIVRTVEDQTIAGTKTFTNPAIPRMDTYSAPTDDEQLAPKKYVDDVAAGGTVSVNRLIPKATAGETVAAGEAVYFDETENEWMLIDASAGATAENILLGIAQGAGTNGVLISGGVLLYGLDTNQAGFTKGDSIYLTDVAGVLGTSAGTKSVQVGYAHSATEIFFAPIGFKAIPTADEKDAMGGTSGVPSTLNKYLTEDDAEDDGIDQSQTTQDADVDCGEADATGKQNSIAQSFVADKTSITGAKLWKEADDGTFTGTVTVELLADDGSDAPTGAALATVTIANVTWAALSDGAEFTATFAAAYAATIGTKYWIKIKTSTADNTNFINIGSNSVGGYTTGSVKYNNTTDGWVAVATIDLYFKVLTTQVSKVVRTNSSGEIDESVLQMTDADTDTLTDGSDADALHTHPVLNKMLGVGYAADSDYYTFQLPYISDITTEIWTVDNMSAASAYTSHTSRASGAAVASILSHGFGIDEGSTLQFDDAKKIIVEQDLIFLAISPAATIESGWGLTNIAAAFQDYDDQTADSCCFVVDGTTNNHKLYAKTGDAGTGHTETEITGITLGDRNTYRIELDPGVEARFYVNGVLEATITTNLPDGATTILFGRGASDNDNYQPRWTSIPSFAIEK